MAESTSVVIYDPRHADPEVVALAGLLAGYTGSHQGGLHPHTRRARDIREGEKLNEAVFKELIRSAVAASSAARARRGSPKK